MKVLGQTKASLPTAVLTWQRLVELDGRLAQLLDEARRTHGVYRDRPFCRNDYWYGRGRWESNGLKHRLECVVGMFRRDMRHMDLLGSAAAYELAYRTLYDALADCHGGECGCL
jgi:hypothetical protein